MQSSSRSDGEQDALEHAAVAVSKEFGCSLESAWRSVSRHWPDAAAWTAEVNAKCSQPCCIALNVFRSQQDYFKSLHRTFYPVTESSFPFFAPEHQDVRSNDAKKRTWGRIMKKLNGFDYARAQWIFLPSPAGINATAENLEEAYNDIVVAEGVRDIVGFCTTGDGAVPLVDYFSARHAGASAEELRQSIPKVAAGLQIRDEDAVIPDSENDWASVRRSARERCDAFLSRWAALHEAPAPAPAQVPLPVMTDHQGSSVSRSSNNNSTSVGSSGMHRRINLLCNDPCTSVSLRQDKANAQRRLAACGLHHIRSVVATTAATAEARRRAANIPFPVIVKPVSGAGSEFVTLCHSPEDIDVAFSVCQAHKTTQLTNASFMVLEEYIDGDEFVVNAVSHNGEHVVSDVWRSWKYPQTTVSTRLRQNVVNMMQSLVEKETKGVTAPREVSSTSLLYDRLEFVHSLSELSPSSTTIRVVEYTLKCLDALGHRNGASHCEVRVDNRPNSPTRGAPILIELNPRVQGDAPRAAELVGYDQYKLLFYLTSAAACFCRTDSITRCPKSSCVPVAWPPAPKLYRCLSDPSMPMDRRITRHVIFLCVPEAGLVNGIAVQRVQALPTFMRLTRGNLFDKLGKNQLACVPKTMDLYSSPGALVMEGTQQDIERDTRFLRAMETASVPASCILDCEQVIRMTCAIAEVMDRMSILKQSFTPYREAWSECVADAMDMWHEEMMRMLESKAQLILSVKSCLRALEVPPLYVKKSHFDVMVRSEIAVVMTIQ